MMSGSEASFLVGLGAVGAAFGAGCYNLFKGRLRPAVIALLVSIIATILLRQLMR